MLRALYTAASGMSAQQLNLDNIANNLSNSSTAGFYARRLPYAPSQVVSEVGALADRTVKNAHHQQVETSVFDSL